MPNSKVTYDVKNIFDALKKLKEKCDSGEFVHGNGLNARKHLASMGIRTSYYSSNLFKLNVIYRDENMVTRWNQKIPPSKKLAETLITMSREMYKKQNDERSDRKKPKRKDIKVDNIRKVETFNNLPQVGLIRRFLRWIY